MTSASVAPLFIFARTTKWFLDVERFLKVSVPLRGIDAGLLAHFASRTALTVPPDGMLRPVSRPLTVSVTHFEALTLPKVSSAT